MPILFCFQKLLSYGDRLDKNKVDEKEVRKEGAIFLERGGEEEKTVD